MTDILPGAAARGVPLSYPDATLAELILARARLCPDAVAVRQWHDQLTYRELVEQAAGVAAALRELGVGPETRVGVCGQRRPALIAAVVGVLFSGGCYVPLEPGSPRRRVLEIAEDAEVSVVVGDAAETEFGSVPGIHAIGMPGPARPTVCPATPDNLAYVLFTSGSTGRPKGVLTTHRNVVQFVTGCAALTGADSSVRALGATSLGFDAAAIDLFVPLVLGGSIQLAGAQDRGDPTRLRRFIVEHGVNWGVLAPIVLSMLDPAELPEWRVVMSGGEAVPADLAARWAPGRRFFDVYGPTETTVFSVAGEVSGDDRDPLPIGLPMPNHRAYLVDDQLRVVEPGAVGELLIGGPGLAVGYLGRPGLTARQFVPDPFSGAPGERLYRTGDLVRQLPDGRIVYLGRTDRQVKIHGQRIELGEIEAVLRTHPRVRHAVAEVVPGGAGPELVAFLTPATAPTAEEIREFARNRLTGAMQPARVLRVDELPVSAVSGKVDRAALRALAESSPDRRDDGESSDGSVERAVTEIWYRVLGARPGRDTDFYRVGGNSVAAMRLVAALRAELGRQVAVEDVFGGRTLAGLVERVVTAEPVPEAEVTVGNPPALSPPQRRLWFMDQLAPTSAPYNIALAERLRGELDVPVLGAALRAVAERHEVLRWRIPQTAGVPHVVCDEPADIAISVVDLSEHPDGEAELRARLAAGAAGAFDLAAGPTWSVTVYRMGPRDHVLAITLHHAVFDGWSQSLFYADLGKAYTAALSGTDPRLPPLRASYADYARWRAERDRDRGDSDLAWWVDHLRGAPVVVELPRDRPRPAVQTYAGAEAGVRLPEPTGHEVGRLAERLGTTPAAVLLAGFGALLTRLTGTDDHVIGAVVADRGLAAFDEVIGFFIDTVPVRLRTRDASFVELVRRCADELRAAPAHPAAPLERVVDALGVARDPSRAPLVQVLFNVLNFAEPRLELPGLDRVAIEVAKSGSPFDLTVYVVERAGRFGFDVVYNPDLFDADRVRDLLVDLVDLVGELVAAPETMAGVVAGHLPRHSVRDPAPGAMTVEADDPDRPDRLVRVGVDRLPAVGRDGLTETERLIAAIWCEVLERPTVGVTDNFFDVGGHSLAVAAVHARLAARTGRSIRMPDLFRYPTIRALAAHLDGAAQRPELARAAQRAAARRSRTRRNTPRRASGTAE